MTIMEKMKAANEARSGVKAKPDYAPPAPPATSVDPPGAPWAPAESVRAIVAPPALQLAWRHGIPSVILVEHAHSGELLSAVRCVLAALEAKP